MAIDQALLESTSVPVLRVYAWVEATVTIGFAQNLAALALPSWPVVRRWTGGGVVLHDSDVTYSLIVPSTDPWAQTRPVDSYRRVHGALAESLNAAGLGPCRLAGDDDRKEGPVCFDAPAVFDVVRGAEKIAGAGQRRNRLGFLHQGSVRAAVAPEFWSQFAHGLAGEVSVQHEPSPSVLERAEELVRTRYGTERWLHEKE